MNRRPPSPRRDRGFTLLEVLVAFLVLSIALGAVLQVFSGGLRSTRVAHGYAVATLLAKSKLADIGIEDEEGLTTGSTGGEFDNGYRWTALVEPYWEEDLPDVEAMTVTPLLVTVTVSWGKGAGSKVRLSTLRLSPVPSEEEAEEPEEEEVEP